MYFVKETPPGGNHRNYQQPETLLGETEDGNYVIYASLIET